jgi:hypothetical protein
MEKYGAWCNGEWPADIKEKADRLQQLAEETAKTIECPDCHGVGSVEAYEDTVFHEKLEAEAEALGAFIMSGEGDPCDVFLAQCRDTPEGDCEHCGSRNTNWLEADTLECYDCGETFEYKESENADNP